MSRRKQRPRLGSFQRKVLEDIASHFEWQDGQSVEQAEAQKRVLRESFPLKRIFVGGKRRRVAALDRRRMVRRGWLREEWKHVGPVYWLTEASARVVAALVLFRYRQTLLPF